MQRSHLSIKDDICFVWNFFAKLLLDENTKFNFFHSPQNSSGCLFSIADRSELTEDCTGPTCFLQVETEVIQTVTDLGILVSIQRSWLSFKNGNSGAGAPAKKFIENFFPFKLMVQSSHISYKADTCVIKMMLNESIKLAFSRFPQNSRGCLFSTGDRSDLTERWAGATFFRQFERERNCSNLWSAKGSWYTWIYKFYLAYRTFNEMVEI